VYLLAREPRTGRRIALTKRAASPGRGRCQRDLQAELENPATSLTMFPCSRKEQQS
jgi:hypothetical protein